ncbi:MAG: L,D-transpeptidase [Terrimicrobiaceae bacterium]|nr:L,D-transpeptidase [Terrimicrobiaceae bacterium]
MTSADSRPGQPGFSIRVSVPAQRLDLLEGDRLVASYPISTSKYGLGCEPGSFRTPTGRFAIDEMIGDGAPPWAAFKSRLPTGSLAMPGGEDDQVLTRILWLAGIDPHNSNTRERHIYIHGTNQEALVGTPASHGCVRMRNDDVIDLYARVRPGTPVEIIA